MEALALLLLLTGGTPKTIDTGKLPSEKAALKTLVAGEVASWPQRVVEIEKVRKEQTRELIEIAEDRSRSALERREAIVLIGSRDEPEAIKFLIENLRLYMPPTDDVRTEKDRWKLTPCTHVLRVHRSKWLVARALLDSLDKFRHDDELLLIAELLQAQLGAGMARLIVNDELARRPGKHRDNFARLCVARPAGNWPEQRCDRPLFLLEAGKQLGYFGGPRRKRCQRQDRLLSHPRVRGRDRVLRGQRLLACRFPWLEKRPPQALRQL